MADPSQAALAAPEKAAPPARPKYRLRFRKAGDLRLVSHHDLMNCMERLCRRAAVPLATSHGFHPKPRMVFALSLALGIVGQNEVLELELTEEWPESVLLERLRQQAPPGIDFHSVRRLAGKSTAQVRRAFYRLALQEPDDAATAGAIAELKNRIVELLSRPHLWIERTRPQPRRVDLRPFVNELAIRTGHLEMALWVTPHGTARPEEIAQMLGLKPLLDQGAYFERSDLEMLDEVDAPPPHLDYHDSKTTSAEPYETEPVPSAARAERPTPLVTGPLAFDS